MSSVSRGGVSRCSVNEERVLEKREREWRRAENVYREREERVSVIMCGGGEEREREK